MAADMKPEGHIVKRLVEDAASHEPVARRLAELLRASVRPQPLSAAQLHDVAQQVASVRAPARLSVRLAWVVSIAIASAAAAASITVVHGRWKAHPPRSAETSTAQGSDASGASQQPHLGDPPTVDRTPGAQRPLEGRRALDRRQAFELGQRIFLPRPPASSGAAPSAPATHHPRALLPGGGGLVDRRQDAGAEWPNLEAQLEKRIGEVRASTARCLDGWEKEDPSLDAGVVLAISVDEQGLREVWIKDRAEAPSGALSCLSNAVYPIDWSGLTKEAMLLTVKIRYAPLDGGQPPEGTGAPSAP
jgi:hypothetical protein